MLFIVKAICYHHKSTLKKGNLLNKILRSSFIFYLGLSLLILSAVLYVIHYLVFQDAHHLLIFMAGDLAFLPIEVLVVVLIIERILNYREKQEKLQKLNMVIGAFFIELGYNLLKDLLPAFKNREEISRNLNVNNNWTRKDFKKAGDYANNLKIDIDENKLNLEELRSLLSKKQDFIMNLLGNPNLLEHDRFTDLLWATTHLNEELNARTNLIACSDRDYAHIIVDIQRMYDHLASEWLNYVEHLQSNYPFLFSLILRTHPFQEKPSPVIT